MGEISDLYIMSQCEFSGIVRNFVHDTLHECGLSLTVLSDKGNLFAPVNCEVDIVEDDMFPVCLAHILADNGIIATAATANKFQS